MRKKKTQDLRVGVWDIAGGNVHVCGELPVRHVGMHPRKLVHGLGIANVHTFGLGGVGVPSHVDDRTI